MPKFAVYKKKQENKEQKTGLRNRGRKKETKQERSSFVAVQLVDRVSHREVEKKRVYFTLLNSLFCHNAFEPAENPELGKDL